MTTGPMGSDGNEPEASGSWNIREGCSRGHFTVTGSRSRVDRLHEFCWWRARIARDSHLNANLIVRRGPDHRRRRSRRRSPRSPAPGYYLDQELWNEARKAAIDEGMPVTRLVEQLLRKYQEARMKQRRGGYKRRTKKIHELEADTSRSRARPASSSRASRAWAEAFRRIASRKTKDALHRLRSQGRRILAPGFGASCCHLAVSRGRGTHSRARAAHRSWDRSSPG
jgi:hypothetical protein